MFSFLILKPLFFKEINFIFKRERRRKGAADHLAVLPLRCHRHHYRNAVSGYRAGRLFPSYVHSSPARSDRPRCLRPEQSAGRHGRLVRLPPGGRVLPHLLSLDAEKTLENGSFEDPGMILVKQKSFDHLNWPKLFL